MENLSRPEFAKLMAGLGEMYRRQISSVTMDMYFASLSDYSISQITQAAQAHCRDPKEGKFFPLPANLIGHIVGHGSLANDVDRAELAWSEIMEGVTQIGSYGTFSIGDKRAVAAVSALGGFKFLCTKTYAELNWIKKSFLTGYKNSISVSLDELAGTANGLRYEPKLDQTSIAHAETLRISNA